MSVVSEKIKEVLLKDGPRELRNYIVANFIVYPANAAKLPACYISCLGTSATFQTNRVDVKKMILRVFSRSANKHEIESVGNELEALIEARNADFSLKSKTILNALWSNQVLDEKANMFLLTSGEAPITINYDIAQNEDLFILSAEVEFSISLG